MTRGDIGTATFTLKYTLTGFVDDGQFVTGSRHGPGGESTITAAITGGK